MWTLLFLAGLCLSGILGFFTFVAALFGAPERKAVGLLFLVAAGGTIYFASRAFW